MAWPTPSFSKSNVNKAGEILIMDKPSPIQLEWAQEVLGNWRACHGYPINTFQATLRKKLTRNKIDAIVAQRLKRTPSIINKLKRFPKMKLARMQDIGGMRAVVKSLPKVRELEQEYKSSRFKHELVRIDDYITNPKSDGYRSVHLAFRYRNNSAPEYNGLLLELQFRTMLQHAWATAVETMGTFLGQALKARQGERRWLEFFEVTGSAFAHIERTSLVPNYESLTKEKTFAKVGRLESKLEVLHQLRGFSIATDMITKKKALYGYAYHLIVLNSKERWVNVTPYSRENLEQAMTEYTRKEAQAMSGEPIEVVLVSAGPIKLLKLAYPNYFLDTRDFIREVLKIIKSIEK